MLPPWLRWREVTKAFAEKILCIETSRFRLLVVTAISSVTTCNTLRAGAEEAVPGAAVAAMHPTYCAALIPARIPQPILSIEQDLDNGAVFCSLQVLPGLLPKSASREVVRTPSLVLVPVGTAFTGRLPERSVRARLRIRLLRRMVSGEASVGVRM